MESGSPLEAPELRALLDDVRTNGEWRTAWRSYRKVVIAAARQSEQPRLLEVGGGRDPLLSQADVEQLNCQYTVNDIDAGELARAPEWTQRLHGDIAAPDLLAEETGTQFDVIFSKMVFEHVAHPEAAYRNTARMLAPGGVFINFIPTWYAPPFLLNWAMPANLSAALLRRSFPNRNEDEVPKFPAFYRWCTATRQTQRRVQEAGFASCEVIPFYGHNYYKKVRPLQALSDRLASVSDRRGWRALSTYAYVICEGYP